MTDILEQLLPCSWTGVNRPRIEFPVTTITLSMDQDLAEHKFWGVDGVQVEATGRNSLVFEATIPFRNGIVPGKSENWGILYPTAFRQFLTACADRATGILVHPELGEFTCKVKSLRTSLTGERRDGVDVTVTWVETLFPEDISNIEDSSNSPVANAEISALSLDSNLDQLTTVDAKYKLPVYAPTFADSVNQLTSITDRISLQEQRYVGVIDKVSYRLNQIEDSVTRVVTPPRTSVKSIINPNPQATNKAIATLAWPIRASIGQLRNTLNDVVKKILQTGQKIIFYRVPSPVTLAGVSVSTGAGIVDLMNLNPSLVGQPFLQTGTMVRYYSGAIR